MGKTTKKIIGIAFLLIWGNIKAADVQAQALELSLGDPAFIAIIEDQARISLDFTQLPDQLDFDLNYWFQLPFAALEHGEQRVDVVYRGKRDELVNLILGEQSKVIRFIFQTDPAKYDSQYIQSHQHTTSVNTPEVYEFGHLLLSLMDEYHGGTYRMNRQGDYYQDILRWFAPHRNHPVFEALQGISYYSFLENAAAYQFNNNQIGPGPTYSGFRAIDPIPELRTLLEDFARVSAFRDFYSQHSAYYASLRTKFSSAVPVDEIWRWLEREFPGRIQSQVVFFSPLGAGNNSARRFTAGDFKEAILFISSPNRYDDPQFSQAFNDARETRSYFTEIDHNYVNPVSDQYIEEINAAMGNLAPWYRGRGYDAPYLTFNEYMTWSVFCLFAREHYSEEVFQPLLAYVEDFIINRRGFFKFKEFNQAMTDLYLNKKDSETITDLYPKILAWVKGQ